MRALLAVPESRYNATPPGTGTRLAPIAAMGRAARATSLGACAPRLRCAPARGRTRRVRAIRFTATLEVRCCRHAVTSQPGISSPRDAPPLHTVRDSFYLRSAAHARLGYLTPRRPPHLQVGDKRVLSSTFWPAPRSAEGTLQRPPRVAASSRVPAPTVALCCCPLGKPHLHLSYLPG